MAMYEVGTVTGAANQAKLTGAKTKWSQTALGIQEGSILVIYRSGGADLYAIKSVDSDTSMTLTRNITTAFAGSSYGIITSETASTSSFANQLASAFSLWRSILEGWSTALTGSGNITLTDPMTGAQVSVPALKGMASAGVNKDINELSALTTLRQRVVSDGEIVAATANGFRLFSGSYGVILRNDGANFYLLPTESGGGRDGGWSALRPFYFNVKSGQVNMENGVKILNGLTVDSGGIRSTKGDIVTAVDLGSNLTNGQTYSSYATATDLTSGNVTTRILIGSRVVAGSTDYGLLTYRDWSGTWNEVRLLKNAELNAGQFSKRNNNGWFWAGGNFDADGGSTFQTNALHIQGRDNTDIYADIYHSEQAGVNHKLAFHVAGGGNNGWYEFRHDGNGYANGAWFNGSDLRMKSDLQPIENALDKLDMISGYTYLKEGKPEAGVIAQEVQRVVPESISETIINLQNGEKLQDGLAVSINGVVALLIQALKEEKSERLKLEGVVNSLVKNNK